MKIDPKLRRVVPVSSVDRKSKDVYETISEQGKRVIVLNVPLTYPPREVNGVIISGFMTPTTASDYANPASVLDEIQRNAGVQYCVSYEENRRKAMLSVISYKNYEEALADDLAETTAIQGKTLLYFLKRNDWDFLMIVFQGTDQIQHNFWKYTTGSTAQSQKYADKIRIFYQQIDGIIGDVLGNVNDRTDLFVLSDHGFMGFSKFLGLNSFLMNKGYLKLRRTPLVVLKRIMFSFGLTPLRFFRWLNKLHLGKYRQALRKEGFRSKIRGVFLSLQDVDWRRSKAHSMGGWGQIYLNSKERFPFGTVDSVEGERLVGSIIEELRGLKEAGTKRLVFSSGKIYRKHEIYTGPHASMAPDITAIPDYPFKAFPDYEFGSNKLVVDAVGWSGTHSMDGIFVAIGPSIAKGSAPLGARLIDIAPTVLYLMGLPIPEDIDGRVLTEVIKRNVLEQRSPRLGAASSRIREETYSYAPADEEELKKTLKGLGYL